MTRESRSVTFSQRRQSSRPTVIAPLTPPPRLIRRTNGRRQVWRTTALERGIPARHLAVKLRWMAAS